MISKIKPKINTVIEGVLAPISKNWNPNYITIISVFLACIPAFLFLQQRFLLGALSLSLFAFDLIDGAVARVHGKTSKFGGFLDAVCDRFADGVVIMGIGLSGQTHITLCFLALITSFLVSYSKAKGEVVIGIDKPGTNELSIGFAERPERLAILFFTSIAYVLFETVSFFGLNFIDLGLVLLILLSSTTAILRIQKTAQILKHQ